MTLRANILNVGLVPFDFYSRPHAIGLAGLAGHRNVWRDLAIHYTGARRAEIARLMSNDIERMRRLSLLRYPAQRLIVLHQQTCTLADLRSECVCSLVHSGFILLRS